MAKGNSGRIVIEIDPALKKDLYLELKNNGLTLKDWFLTRVTSFLKDDEQISLAFERIEQESENRTP
ncbi:hypothetical protein ACYVVI_00780 [Arenicellales bacterium IMCC57338]|jgi:hypothetical protein